MRHVASGWYLHLLTEDEGAALDLFGESDDAADISRSASRTSLPAAAGGETKASVRRLVATPRRYDFDMFGCQLVSESYHRDLTFVNGRAEQLQQHVRAFGAATRPADVDFGGVQAVLSDLIISITEETDNLDALTREGLARPVQQVLMRELWLLDLCMQLVSAPFAEGSPFTKADIRGGNRALHITCRLSQHLLWHMLRGCTVNRMYAARYVPKLTTLLGYGIGVAGTLTEIFTDNEALLDKIDDSTIRTFLELIRADGGRHARYVDFLICLCHASGKAVRHNQWRICRMLIDEAPELLLKLSHDKARGVMVEGHPKYFPALGASTPSQRPSGGAAEVETKCELGVWLERTSETTRNYFERCLDLFGHLCEGRNLRNTPSMREKLPYDLAMAMITNGDLPLGLRSRVVGVVQEMYIDADPHDTFVHVRLLRKWNEVEKDSKRTRELLSRQPRSMKVMTGIVMPLHRQRHSMDLSPTMEQSSHRTESLDATHDDEYYNKFNDLKDFIRSFLNPLMSGKEGLVATEVDKNTMVLHLLRALYHLVRGGFTPPDVLPSLAKRMLVMLSGKLDRIGVDGEKPEDRYKRKRMVKTPGRPAIDTVLMMECKLWLCQTLQLVCTVRLDLRLDLLLDQYRQEFDAGVWEGSDAHRGRFLDLERAMEKQRKMLLGKGSRQATMKRRLALPIDESAKLPQASVRKASRTLPTVFSGELPGLVRGRSGKMGVAKVTAPSGGPCTPSSLHMTEPTSVRQNIPIGGVELGGIDAEVSELTANASKLELGRDGDTTSTRGSRAKTKDDARDEKKAGMMPGLDVLGELNIFDTPEARALRARRERPEELDNVLSFRDTDVVDILTDLTRYELQSLTSEAVVLLVRQYEQHTTLLKNARQVQLLVRPAMIENYAFLERRTRQLERLAVRRRLYDHELYEAAWLMGELTLSCFDAEDGDSSLYEDSSRPSSRTRVVSNAMSRGGMSAAQSSAFSRGTPGGVRSINDVVERTRNTCLVLIGRATTIEGSRRIAFLEHGLRGKAGGSSGELYENDILWVGHHCYRVAAMGVETSDDAAPVTIVTLDRPLVGKSAQSEWVQTERRISGPNHDRQLLLSKLGASKVAMQLLQLPFDMTQVRPAERKIRAMVCAAYRLLRAMCNEFSLLQTELAQHLDLFCTHTEAALVEDDISPTQCIIAVCEGNREACTQVTPSMVRHFAELSGQLHRPRYLRFLRTIMAPGGNTVISRNQNLVVSALMGVSEALVLFNDDVGRAERQVLIESGVMESDPRGKLVYHVELVSLLASVASSDDQTLKSLVRDVLPLKDIFMHLTSPSLTFGESEAALAAMLPLRASYLSIMHHAYLAASRRALATPLKDVAGIEGFAALIAEMARVVGAFTGRWLGDETAEAFLDDDVAIRARSFVVDSVLSVMAELYDGEHLSIKDLCVETATEALVGALSTFLDKTKLDPSVSPRHGYRILRAARKLGVTGTVHVPDEDVSNDERLASSGINTLADLATPGQAVASETAGRKREHRPQDTLLDFVSRFEDELEVKSEFDALMHTFLGDLDGGDAKGGRNERHEAFMQRYDPHGSFQSLHPSVQTELSRSRLSFLVQNIERCRVAEGGVLTEVVLAHQLAALRVLQSILGMHDFHKGGVKAGGEVPRLVGRHAAREARELAGARELRRRQSILTELGAARVCIMMIRSDDAQLCEVGLQLAASMLRGGNARVQAAIYELIADPTHVASCRAFDGGSSSFFDKMRHLLRVALGEIREAKIYREQQRERLAVFEEHAHLLDWSDATKAVMLLEVSRPFASRSFVMDVLELLRLLCEGHNTLMQDLLREQSTATTSARVDLVSEIASLLVALDADMDDHNATQVLRCVETLTELCQGNASMGNTKLLSDRKVIYIAERLILMRDLRGVPEEMLTKLRARAITLLMAMLEGADRSAERVMLSRLNVGALVRMLNFLFAKSRPRAAAAAAAAAANAALATSSREVSGDQRRITSRVVSRAMTRAHAGVLSGVTGVADAAGSASKRAQEQLADTLALNDVPDAQSEDGYALYILLRHLEDYEEQESNAALAMGDEPRTTFVVRDALDDEGMGEALTFYGRLVGSAEIVNASGALERVFFRFPELCLSLTDARKLQLEWAVDRQTPGAQLLQFIEAADELHAEMKHGHALERFWVWRFAKRNVSMFDNSLIILAVVTNIALILRSGYCIHRDGRPRAWSTPFCSTAARRAVYAYNNSMHLISTRDDIFAALGDPIGDLNATTAAREEDFNYEQSFFHVSGDHTEAEGHIAVVLQVVVFSCGILLCFSSVLVFVLDMLRSGGPRVRRLVLRYVQRWQLLRSSSFDEIQALVHDAPWRFPWFYPLCVICFLANKRLIFMLFTLVAAINGLAREPYWFCFSLLDFASKSPEINIVAAALLQNLRAIFMTVVFVVIVVYLYAVLGYRFLADIFFYLDFQVRASPRISPHLPASPRISPHLPVSPEFPLP